MLITDPGLTSDWGQITLISKHLDSGPVRTSSLSSGSLIIYLVLVLEPLLPVVSQAVEGGCSSVREAVVLWGFMPLQQWWYSPFLHHCAFDPCQCPQWQLCHGDVVEEPLADGVGTRRPRVAIKYPEQHATTTWQVGGAAATVLTGVIGWQHVAMETQHTVGGRSSGEGVAVFIGLATDDKSIVRLVN